MSAAPDLSSVLGGPLSQFDLSALNVQGFPSFSELASQAMAGQLDLTLPGIARAFGDMLFSELITHQQLVRQLLIVAVLSALLKCLSDAFRHKAAGELGFYVSYIMMVLLAMTSFRLAAGILTDALRTVSGMMEASVPLVISVMAVSGNAAGAAVFQPALILAVNLVIQFISVVFIPLVLSSAALTAVNFLLENAPLTKLVALVRKGAEWMMKGLAALFILLLTLQKISVPIINNFALKTARSAASAVPVVGNALNSAMDAVLSAGQAAKSGVMAALIILLCAAAAVPLVKMLVIMLVYRVSAAVTQPIAEPRFTACMDQVGACMGLLLNAGILTAAMLVSAVVILLAF